MSTSNPLGSGLARGRGRPSIGKPVTSRLSEEDHAFALELGDGGDAIGIRRAVKIVAAMGIDRARELCKELEISGSTDSRKRKTKPKQAPKPPQPVTQVTQPATEPKVNQETQEDDIAEASDLDEMTRPTEGVLRHGT